MDLSTALENLGTDAIYASLLPQMPMQARHALACIEHKVQDVLSPALRSSELILDSHASRDYAFMMRTLRGKLMLSVPGSEHVHDLVRCVCRPLPTVLENYVPRCVLACPYAPYARAPCWRAMAARRPRSYFVA